MQGVEGGHAAGEVDVLEQGAQGRGLAALVAAAAARARPAAVGDQGDGLEVRVLVRVPVGAADALRDRRSRDVGGQRRRYAVMPPAERLAVLAAIMAAEAQAPP